MPDDTLADDERLRGVIAGLWTVPEIVASKALRTVHILN
jgi:hypothetical protein